MSRGLPSWIAFARRSPPGCRSSAAGQGRASSAKCEEAGGIDLIVIYNSGRFRMAGRGSLAGMMPYGNANAIVKEMAHEVLDGSQPHARSGGRLCAPIRS